MSDDLGKKIKQISDVLGQDTLPDNIKGLLSLLANSSSREDTPSKQAESVPAKEGSTARGDTDDNIEMFRKVKKLVEGANVNSDPRINLLNALKPFLNGSRQKKVGSCIKLLQMTRLARLMDDNEKTNP